MLFGFSNVAKVDYASAFGYSNEASGLASSAVVSGIKRPVRMPALSAMAIMLMLWLPVQLATIIQQAA